MVYAEVSRTSVVSLSDGVHEVGRLDVLHDPLRHVAILPALHDTQEQLRSIVLQLQDQAHPPLGKGVDVVQNDRDDDVDAVALLVSYCGLRQVWGEGVEAGVG